MTGRAEVWQGLHAALKIVWAGGDLLGPEGGLATAQLILDAAGVTVPSGNLAGGAFDHLGESYTMPSYVVSDPINLIVDASGGDEDAAMKGDDVDEEGSEAEDKDDEEVIAARREDKGKAKLDPKNLVKLRARLSEGAGPDIVMSIGKNDSVRLLNRKLLEASGVSQIINHSFSSTRSVF